MIAIYAQDPVKNKKIKVGTFHDGVLYKNVDPAKHKLKMWDCYGIQQAAFFELTSLGCHTIKISEGDRVLTSKFEAWLEPRIKTKDWGGGLQRFFPVKDMLVGEA